MSTNDVNITLKSGRFLITKTKCDEADDNEIFDVFMLKLFDIVRQVYLGCYNEEVPFYFEFETDGTLKSAKLKDSERFNELFGSKINMLKLYNSRVKILCNNQYLNYMIKMVDDENLLKCEIMKLLGGNLFPMFPECIGFVYNLYYSSLLKFDPHEFLKIDENCLLKYFKYKINQNM